MAGSRGGDPRFKMTPGGSAVPPCNVGVVPGKARGGVRNTFDPHLSAMFERRQFWAAHWVMNEEPYWHLEGLCHPDQIGESHSLKLAEFPIRCVGTWAAPVRAVAILER